MRILMVTPEFSTDGRSGGAGIYIYHLCRELAQQGHGVDVIANVDPGCTLREPPFNLYKLKLSKLRVIGMLKWTIKAYVCSIKLMQTKKYDVVNVHSLSLMYPLLYSSRIPMVITRHGGWPLTNPRYPFHRKLFRVLAELVSCKKSRKIIVLNGFLKQKLLRWGISQKKITYVPNAINPQEFLKKNESKMICEKLGVSQEALVLLCVGRLDKGKGVENLLEAFRMVQSRATRPVSLVIVGDGSLRLSLMRSCSNLNNVFFTGSISRNDVISAYRESDLFVMPSEGGEGMPTVLLEAMAAGLPIVSTRIPGTVEIVKEEFGTLVSPRNPHELACALLDMIADKATLREMGRRAASWSKQFDWNIVAGRVVKVYESCLRR
jgi:glycosyltransferase involved in cell wall biosynthesis